MRLWKALRSLLGDSGKFKCLGTLGNLTPGKKKKEPSQLPMPQTFGVVGSKPSGQACCPRLLGALGKALVLLQPLSPGSEETNSCC